MKKVFYHCVLLLLLSVIGVNAQAEELKIVESLLQANTPGEFADTTGLSAYSRISPDAFADCHDRAALGGVNQAPAEFMIEISNLSSTDYLIRNQAMRVLAGGLRDARSRSREEFTFLRCLLLSHALLESSPHAQSLISQLLAIPYPDVAVLPSAFAAYGIIQSQKKVFQAREILGSLCENFHPGLHQIEANGDEAKYISLVEKELQGRAGMFFPSIGTPNGIRTISTVKMIFPGPPLLQFHVATVDQLIAKDTVVLRARWSITFGEEGALTACRLTLVPEGGALIFSGIEAITAVGLLSNFSDNLDLVPANVAFPYPIISVILPKSEMVTFDTINFDNSDFPSFPSGANFAQEISRFLPLPLIIERGQPLWNDDTNGISIIWPTWLGL